MEPPQTTNNNYSKLHDDFEKFVNWQKYLFLFLSNWYWFLIIIFLSMSVAYMINRYSLLTYQATATILIEDEEGTGDIINEIRSVRRLRKKTDLANEIAKLHSFSLHRRTIDSLKWDIVWTGYGRVAMKRPLYENPPYYIDVDSASHSWFIDRAFYLSRYDNAKLRLYNDAELDTIILLDTWHDINGWKFRIKEGKSFRSYASFGFVVYSPNTLASQYLSKVVYQADEDQGTIITIQSEGPVAKKEIDYINALCDNYIISGLERKRLIAENTLKFVNDQISIIQDSLSKTETQLLQFRLNQNLVDLSKEGQQAYDKLQNFYNQKTELKLKRNYYDYLVEYIESKRDPQAIISPILVDANDQLLINQVQNLQILYEDREMLAFSAATENPSIIQLNARIQTLRLTILEVIEGLIRNNELASQQLTIEEKLVEKQLLRLPASEQELLNIQRKHEVNNQFYTFLLQKGAEAGIQIASTVSNVRIIDRAVPYTVVVTSTKQSLIYFLAIILGLLFPAGIILMVDYFDNRIKDRYDVEFNTNLPILGIVSHIKYARDIPVQVKPGSAFTESFRHIRTNLQYILRELDQKVIMISSTISGEGKTFIALNLATIIAMSNKKVLICDFDMRRPTLHKIFNQDNSEGTSLILAGKIDLPDIINKTNIQGLDVLVSGPIPPNPAELLDTDYMKDLIDKASEEYDYIVIDTPPVALVTDANLISKYSHTNIFIIRQNYTPKGVLEMINKLSESQYKSLSIIINDIKESKTLGYRYYYGYNYSYNYQYKYGYKYYHEDSDAG
jgi:capsular exopolysaccharide synthesis family protein